MAARSNVDVSERRLRPIYDCLDNGNNKKAVQEADKVLKKQHCLLCAKVLKALALLRLGQHDECVALVAEVFKQNPSDESTLQAMTICYNELHKLDTIAELYENAHRVQPDSEDILSSLFMAYVRISDYKKQQQTAMRLHRLQPTKNPYYFWAIMSIVMQAHSADAKLAKVMFLPLAERMAEKYVLEEKIEAEAEVQMYLIILQLLGKRSELLKVLQSPLADKLTSEIDFRDVKCACLYKELQQWPQMNSAYKNLLNHNPDAWNYYLEYLTSLFKLIDSQWQPADDQCEDSEDGVDYTVDQAVAFLAKQLSCGGRGPRLAQMKLASELEQRQQGVHRQLGDVSQLMQSYFSQYSHCTCCFGDMTLFLPSLDDREKERLMKGLFDEHGFKVDEVCAEITYVEDVKSLQIHTTLLQLARYAGLHSKLDTEQKYALVTELVKRYRHALKFGEGLLSTDLQYSDPYLQLAVVNLYDIWLRTRQQHILWQAALLLEEGLIKSSANYQFKILLIKLYASLGAFSLCASFYESLELKNIQNDTLGYLLHGQAARLGHIGGAQMFYDTVLRFFTGNHKDTTEYIISSYKYGSFTKIHEFVKFRERLQNSLQFASTTTERMLLNLTQETRSHCTTQSMIYYMEIDPALDKTVWSEMADNRDLNILNTWDVSRDAVEDMKKVSFKEEKTWLAVRSLTLRCLAAAVMLTSPQPGGATCTPEVLSQLLTELRQLTARTERLPVQPSLCCSFRTRLCTYVTLRLDAVLTNAIDVVLQVYNTHAAVNNATQNESKITLLVMTICGDLTDVISNVGCLTEEESGRVVFNGEVIEKLVLIAETLSHVVLLAGSCRCTVQPLQTRVAKVNRKKKVIAEPPPTILTQVANFVAGLQTAVGSLLATLTAAKQSCLAVELSRLHLTDTLLQAEDSALQSEDSALQCEVWKRVLQSYEQSLDDTLNFVRCKEHYVDSLAS